MKTVNYIVHPEHAILSSDIMEVAKYAEKICSIAQEQESYVVMSYFSPAPQTAFQELALSRLHGSRLVAPEKRLYSNGFLEGKSYFPFGHIRNESWEKFTTSLEDADMIRIHGCFLGEACLQNLAVQAYQYLSGKKHSFNWPKKPGLISLVKELVVYEFIQLAGSLKKFSQIKYGVAYSNAAVGRNESLRLVPKILRGQTIDDCLIDSETRIFGED